MPEEMSEHMSDLKAGQMSQHMPRIACQDSLSIHVPCLLPSRLFGCAKPLVSDARPFAEVDWGAPRWIRPDTPPQPQAPRTGRPPRRPPPVHLRTHRGT